MDKQENTGMGNELPDALESLFSDPQARERFEKIIGSLKENLQTDPASKSPQESKAPPFPPGTDGLASILSNPRKNAGGSQARSPDRIETLSFQRSRQCGRSDLADLSSWRGSAHDAVRR